MSSERFFLLFCLFGVVGLNLLAGCSSDIGSISDVPANRDLDLRACKTKDDCNANEICEGGYCKRGSVRQCRTRDDCIYPEECISGVCKTSDDVGSQDVSDLDIAHDTSAVGGIIADPQMIDFGAMQFGETKRQNLTIRNVGSTDLTIYSFELDPQADLKTFSISSTFTKNSILKPDDSFIIEARCTQTDADPDNTSIIISSSDSQKSILRVPIYNRYKDKPNISVRYKTLFGVEKGYPAQGDTNEINYDMGNTSLDSGKNVNVAEFEIINTASEGILKIEKITDYINTKNHFEYQIYDKISNKRLGLPVYIAGSSSVFLRVIFTATNKSTKDTMDLNIYTNDPDINGDGSENENGLLIIRLSTRAGIFPATLWTSENAIDFGQVKIMDVAHRRIQICNKGDEDLIIYNTSRVLGGKFTLTPSNIEKVLLSGLCYNIDIAFAPTKEEIVEDILQINSNDPENLEYKIGLRGEGISCIKQSEADDPDDLFVDANCDGIDGEISAAIFVDVVGGNDGNSGGLDSPFRTISYAITASSNLPAKRYILVSEGDYFETFTLTRGISIYGGYSRGSRWQRSDSYKVNIYPSSDGIRVSDNSNSIVLDRLNISSQDAILPSSSSYGMFVTSSSRVKINRSTIKAGRGAKGGDGVSGRDGAVNDSNRARGGSGTPGCEDSGGILCTNCSRPVGGAGGISACNMNGGKGGDAGKSSDYGLNGASGTGPSGSGGAGGLGGPPGRGASPPLSSQYGQNGADGAKGNNGRGGGGIGTFSKDGYLPTNSGEDGAPGVDGAGGGGGGGGGGGTVDCDSYGSSGGGGGAGGCGGGPGEGGKGGGASIGLFIYRSTVDLVNSVVSAQNGGDGGMGGNGGLGSAGGAAGEGGAYGGSTEQDDGSMGGPGGSGGRGGDGGAGGGGGGGPSFAIYKCPASTITQSGTTLNRGSGGNGGRSAGNAGQNGASAEIYP